MSKYRRFAYLETLLTSGLDVMTQMPAVSEALKALVPSFSLSMVRVDERAAPRHHYSEYFDEASHRLFAESGHLFAMATDDPAAFGNLLRPGRRPFGSLVETSPGFVAGGTYEHLFKRNGIHHVLDVAIRDTRGPLGILGMFREKDAKHFRAEDVAVVARLYPWLVHAFAAHRSAANDDGGGLLAYDEVDTAMLVANDRGEIQWASPRARGWLDDASTGADRVALRGRPSGLPEACRALCRTWSAGRRASTSARKSAEVPTLTLPLPGGRLRLRAYGLAAELDARQDGALIGIQLSLEMSRTVRVVTALDRSTLTPKQQRIALGLWLGRSPRALRESLGISASTLKSYQKDMYVRLDVRSAAELVATLDLQGRAITFDLERHRPMLVREGALRAPPTREVRPPRR